VTGPQLDLQDSVSVDPVDPAVARRLDAFEALKSRAELYRSVLQVHVEDLEKTLGALAVSVESLLNQKAAA